MVAEHKTQTTFERILDDLGARASGDGYTARCPAHHDENPSLSLRLADNGTILMKCHAGCTIDAICAALALERADLSSKPRARTGPPITVKDLAEAKRLPWPFLSLLGLADWRTGVMIPYYLPNRTEAPRSRLRTELCAKGSKWLGKKVDGEIVPYGLDRLAQARKAGYLLLAEGESDCWTLWHHGFPALGIPGADMTGKLQAVHLKGIARLYVVREPDEGGDTFVAGIRKRLAYLHWHGEALQITMPGGAKDPNELHQRDPDHFKEAIEAAKMQATPLESDEDAGDDDDEEIAESSPIASWPDPMGDAAFIGPLGAFVNKLGGETEAAREGLLIQLIVAFGSAVGRNAYVTAEADKHYTNLFAVLVAGTGTRKGTSWGQVREHLRRAIPGWEEEHVTSGLSTGEGLINLVCDEAPKIPDKVALIVESEFASVFQRKVREGNTLSPVMRQSWDGGALRVMTRTAPLKATDAHISIIGHISPDELRHLMTATDAGNGFGNRILFACVRRARYLPHGGLTVDFSTEATELKDAIQYGRKPAKLQRDSEAKALWASRYRELSGGRPGVLGKVTNRAEAQVMRLSLIYALSERSSVIQQRHLEAALEVWRYCFDSARFLFGMALGDALAEKLDKALQERGEQGMTRTEMSQHLSGNHSKEEINRALGLLAEQGRAEKRRELGAGRRTITRWYTRVYKDEFNENNEDNAEDEPADSLNSLNSSKRDSAHKANLGECVICANLGRTVPAVMPDKHGNPLCEEHARRQNLI